MTMKPTLMLLSLWIVSLFGVRPVPVDSTLVGVDANGNAKTRELGADAYLQGKDSLSVAGRESRSAVEALMHSVDGLNIEYRADIQLNAIEHRKIANRKLAEEIVHSR